MPQLLSAMLPDFKAKLRDLNPSVSYYTEVSDTGTVLTGAMGSVNGTYGTSVTKGQVGPFNTTNGILLTGGNTQSYIAAHNPLSSVTNSFSVSVWAASQTNLGDEKIFIAVDGTTLIGSIFKNLFTVRKTTTGLLALDVFNGTSIDTYTGTYNNINSPITFNAPVNGVPDWHLISLNWMSIRRFRSSTNTRAPVRWEKTALPPPWQGAGSFRT